MITLYGRHACQLALVNPKRKIHKLVLCNGSTPPFDIPKDTKISYVDKKFFDKLAPDGASQNVALEANPLESGYIEELQHLEESTVLVLDQLTDPRNVGAIFRNAAAFGVNAIMMHDRNSPKENAVLVKTACGGFDLVNHIYVKNIAQAIETLKNWGYWSYGLAEGGNQMAQSVNWPKKRVIVMGAEGTGMRNLVKKTCDEIITIATNENFSTLNVVNATAVILHAAFTASYEYTLTVK